VVLIGSSSSKPSGSEHARAVASAQEAPAAPMANDLPALLPPPMATGATAAPAEAARPAATPSSAPRDEADPATPAQESAPSSPSRGVRPPGGDKPKSGSDEPKFRPRGI